MAGSRFSSTTSVMVSRILEWLLSHVRLERHMVRDWARLGSTVEKKKTSALVQKRRRIG